MAFKKSEVNVGQKKVITVHTVRPKRDEVIQLGEVIDLRILLETTKSVDEFLEKVRYSCQI